MKTFLSVVSFLISTILLVLTIVNSMMTDKQKEALENKMIEKWLKIEGAKTKMFNRLLWLKSKKLNWYLTVIPGVLLLAFTAQNGFIAEAIMLSIFSFLVWMAVAALLFTSLNPAAFLVRAILSLMLIYGGFTVGVLIADAVPMSFTQGLLLFVNGIFFLVFMSVFWLIVAGPLVIVHLVAAAYWIAEIIMRMLAQSKTPILVLIAVFGAFGGYLVVREER